MLPFFMPGVLLIGFLDPKLFYPRQRSHISNRTHKVAKSYKNAEGRTFFKAKKRADKLP